MIRKQKVYLRMRPMGKHKSEIRIINDILEQYGFTHGDNISIEYSTNQLLIVKEDENVLYQKTD